MLTRTIARMPSWGRIVRVDRETGTAGMVVYLAGPGGRHVTGSSTLVDGGFAA